MIRSIIIDDEEQALRSLENLIDLTSPHSIEVVDKASSVDEAFQKIKKHKPQLIFLDIQMPGGNGFDLIRRFEHIDFEIIFTTAFDEYAIQAVRFAALDYLLKPINKNELSDAIERTKLKLTKTNTIRSTQLNNLLKNAEERELATIALFDGKGYINVELNSIMLLKAHSNYTEFHFTNSKKLLTSSTLGVYEELLKDHSFTRVHKSTIVNLDHVERYQRGDGGTLTLTNNEIVKVSRQRKTELIKLLRTKNII